MLRGKDSFRIKYLLTSWGGSSFVEIFTFFKTQFCGQRKGLEGEYFCGLRWMACAENTDTN